MNEFKSPAPGNASSPAQVNGEANNKDAEDVNGVSQGSCFPFSSLDRYSPFYM